ncbi:MAG: hypothetical protein VXZ38_00665, partial [Planctomycetota bacterium]|nr:hypothetical protein [Planctomycetota bacterium]
MRRKAEKTRAIRRQQPCFRSLSLRLFFGVVSSCCVCLNGAEKFQTGNESSLTLVNGEVVPGEPSDSEGSEVVRWLGEAFCDPFEIRQRNIRSIQLAARSEMRPPEIGKSGDLVFELSNGDILHGQLMDWGRDKILVEHALAGQFELPLDSVRWIHRKQPVSTRNNDPELREASPKESSLEWFGFHDPDQRASASGASSWRLEGERLWSTSSGARIRKQLEMPGCLVIDLQVAWDRQPDFVCYLGRTILGEESDLVQDENSKHNSSDDLALPVEPRNPGWRLECSGQDLVMTLDQPGFVDVQKVLSLEDRSDLRLIIYFNGLKGTIEVLTESGKPLATTMFEEGLLFGGQETGLEQSKSIGPQTVPAELRVELVNLSESLSVQRFQLHARSGEVAKISDRGVQATLVEDTKVPGVFSILGHGIQRGVVTGFDGSALQFSPTTNSASLDSFPLDRLSEARFPVREGQIEKDLVGIHLVDGSVLSGQIRSVRSDVWILHISASQKDHHISADAIRTVRFRNSKDEDIQEVALAGRVGRLIIGSHATAGRLVPGERGSDPDALGLSWHPLKSLNSAPIRRSVHGVIEYREPSGISNSGESNKLLEQQRNKNQRLRRGLNFGELFLRRTDLSKEGPIGEASHLVHMRSGDMLRCKVQVVREGLVQVSAKSFGLRKIPVVEIKAIELVSNSPPPNLDEAKKQRLLTIPRLQKSDPSTHLLCSHNGDFLRCNMLEMGEDFVLIKVQVSEIRVPRERIAQVIWLHPEESNGAIHGKMKVDGSWGDRLDLRQQTDSSLEGGSLDRQSSVSVRSGYVGLTQVLLNDGKRFSFTPKGLEEGQVTGVNRWGEKCEFDLGRVDQLLIGESIKESVKNVGYNQWKMTPADEPLVSAVLQSGKQKQPELGELVGLDLSNTVLTSVKGGEIRFSEMNGRW